MTQDEIMALPYRPCVGLMVINKDGCIFAGKRLDNPGNAWQMPQGGVEKGEDPADAALRELEEETGIRAGSVEVLAQTKDWIPYDLPHHLVRKLWKGKYRGQKQIWFLLRFSGDDREININTRIPEFSHWCWMPAADLLSNIVPFKRETYQRVIREFKDMFS